MRAAGEVGDWEGACGGWVSLGIFTTGGVNADAAPPAGSLVTGFSVPCNRCGLELTAASWPEAGVTATPLVIGGKGFGEVVVPLDDEEGWGMTAAAGGGAGAAAGVEPVPEADAVVVA